MSDAPKAVFLSYASQDAEAVKRIADALRQSGVEVWFDAEGGLEHGDEWDAKIRRQVKECVLFIPVISANTQAREEGYFRLEWDMAAERARSIASGVAFILPVLIDGTKEPDALVPDRFRSVQWTKLPGGTVPPDVLQRLLKLWSHRTGLLKHEAVVGRDLPIPPSGNASAEPAGFGDPALQRKKRVFVAAALVVALGLVGVFVLRPKPQEGAAARPSAAEKKPAPSSNAGQLVAKARALFENPNYTGDDLKLAEELCQQATKLDPNDAEVWAVYAELSGEMIGGGSDRSPGRMEAARTQAERAVKLAPESNETRFAKASYLRRMNGSMKNEAEKILRDLLKRTPDDPRVLISLGKTIWGNIGGGRNFQRADESLEFFTRAAAIPAARAEALRERGWLLWDLGRNTEAEAAIDDSLAVARTRSGTVLKIYLACDRGDLDSARANLATLTGDVLRSDQGASLAARVWLWSRDPARCLEALGPITRDYLSSNFYNGPTELLRAQAYRMAGKAQAARNAWQAAIQVVEKRLVNEPQNQSLLRNRAELFAALGDRATTTTALQLYDEVSSTRPGSSTNDGLVRMLIEPPDRAVEMLEGLLRQEPPSITPAWLRFAPEFDPLRDDPQFQALLARVAPTVTSVEPAPVDAKSVAVLAFENLSDDKANEYFSDGIAEELLTVLQKIPGLHVAARTSAFSFKGKSATAQEIGEKLGVAVIVEGSVRKSGNKVRITARLSRAATGEQLWSESYTRDLQDVFAVQSELAETIVGQLRGQLGGAATKAEIQAQVSAAEIGGTKNVEAHELYLQGRYFANQLGPENLVQATDRLQRAVALDPAFAQAWAEMVNSETLRIGYATSRAEAEASLTVARHAADRALALAPDLAATHLARWEIQATCDFDWKGADASIRRALQLAPADAIVVSSAAFQAYFFGRLEPAIELSGRALALDPVNPLVHQIRARIFEALRRFDEALAENRRYTELSPTNAWAHTSIGRIYVDQGRFDEAVAEAEQGPVEWARMFVLAMARWGQKKTAESDAALTRLISGSGDVAAIQVAQAYAYRRQNDQAFAWLERALAQHDPGLSFSKADLTLGALHADPRWDAFMRKVGLADDQLK